MSVIPNIKNLISAGNSTTTLLGAGATFTGVWEDVTNYTTVASAVLGSTATDGTLYFDLSTDNGSTFTSVPSTIGDTTFAVPRILNVVETHVRIRYVNGTTPQTGTFSIQTKYSVGQELDLLGSVDGFVNGEYPASVVKAVSVGQTPTGGYSNQKTDGVAFKTTTDLNPGQTFDSGVLDLRGFTQVQTQIVSDQNGTLSFIFGSEVGMTGTTIGASGVDRIITLPYYASNGFELYSAPAFTDFVRYEFTNNGATATNHLLFDTKFLTKSLSGQVLTTNSPISPSMVANLGRNIIVGRTDGGDFINVPVDEKGHLEVALHSPLNPFGSIHTEKLTPIFQTDAVYGINEGQVYTTTSLGGTSTSIDSKFKVGTGTTQFAQGSLQSRRRLRYRPGQGIVGRFTAKFSTPQPFSYQIAGFGHAEDGVYFGYKDLVGATAPEFGILYVNRAVREIQTLNITTASSTAEFVQVVLAGATSSVPVTNSNDIQRTVYEISQFDYTGWDAYPDGDNVVFIANSAGNKTGSFALNAATAVGTFTETKAGSSGIEQFIPQSQWNGDKLDGTGTSGVTLDPTKGNIYQIGIQYLGFGAIEFKVEVVSGGNNPIWVNVHTMDNPNNLTTTTFSNPAFPFTMAAYSAGSTANLEVESGSFAGFVEGRIETRGNRFVYENTKTAIPTVVYTSLGTILNKRVYNGKASQVVVNIKQFAAHIEDSASGGSMYLIRNGTLQGNPNFQDYSSTSSTSWDTSATTVTFTDKNQLVATLPLGINGADDVQLDDLITLQPGETLTLAAKADSTSLDYCTIAVTTREDQ